MSKNVLIAILAVALVGLALYTFYPSLIAQAPSLGETETATTTDDMTMCAQVVTAARNPDTGEIKEYPTPCDVPEGWEVIQNDIPGFDLEVQ